MIGWDEEKGEVKVVLIDFGSCEAYGKALDSL